MIHKIKLLFSILFVVGVLSAEVIYTRVGVFTPFTNNDDAKMATEAIETIKDNLHQYGSYDLFDENRMRRDFSSFDKDFPAYCHEPRCAAQLGVMLELNKMIYGDIIKNENTYAVELVLIDVMTNGVAGRVSLEGDPGVTLAQVVNGAVDELLDRKESADSSETRTDKPVLKRYYGEQVDNRRMMLISSAGYVATTLIAALISNDHQDAKVGDDAGWDDDLSGIDPSMRTITSSARAKALGDAYVGMSRDAYGVFFNPAGAAWVDGIDLSITYQRGIGMINGITGSFVNKATREIGWGHSFQYYGHPDSYLQELYFGTVFAYRFNDLFGFMPPLSLGVGLNVSSIKTTGGVGISAQSGTGVGIGIDLGGMVEFTDKIDFGFVFQNVPSFTSYNNITQAYRYIESQAPRFNLGASYEVRYGTLLVAEGRIPLKEDQNWSLHGGVEQYLFGYARLRLGAFKEMFENRDAPWHITMGLGADVPMVDHNLKVDISYDLNTDKMAGSELRDNIDVSVRFDF